MVLQGDIELSTFWGSFAHRTIDEGEDAAEFGAVHDAEVASSVVQ
jgi:hypothetical protein